MARLKWLEGKPTESGWYWYRKPSSEILPVRVANTPELIAVYYLHYKPVKNMDGNWAGPIYPPKLKMKAMPVAVKEVVVKSQS